MSQISFSDAEYAGKRKKTRREVFLEEMEQVVPWKALLKVIAPFYPVAGRGRRPYPLESMLRVHLMQNWFALSDPAMEEALYEITSLRSFAGLKLSEPIPDETTILNFRHMLEEYDLAEDILKEVNAHLTRKGLLLKRGALLLKETTLTMLCQSGTLTTATAGGPHASQARRHHDAARRYRADLRRHRNRRAGRGVVQVHDRAGGTRRPIPAPPAALGPTHRVPL